MQNKSSLNINVGGQRPVPTDKRPTNEFPIENVPIYSMKKDLEMIGNPEMMRPESAPLPISSNPQPNFPSRISPFLEKTSSNPIVPLSQKKVGNLVNKIPTEQTLESETSDSSSEFDLKKVFVFSIIFLSVIALGIGSYYFWLVRGNEPEQPPTQELPTAAPVEETPLPAAIVEPEIKITAPQENTLVLDLKNSTPAKIKTELKNQIEKLPKESFTKPVEFKIRDSQNNLVNFSDFAEKSGLTFAKSLSAYLGESFSLFAFDNGSALGTGLMVESKNDAVLARELLRKEAVLPKDLGVLFLIAAPATTKRVSFSNFTYKDATLRYFNLISPEKLSVDYTVKKNKLIIGTTKAAHLAIYDWLLLKPDTP